MGSIDNRTLLRQMARLGLEVDAPPDGAQWAAFLQRVARAYDETDQERYLSERSMALASEEMRVLHGEAAAQSEFLSAIIASLADGLCVIGADGRIELDNPAASALLCARGLPLTGLDEARILGAVQPADGDQPDPVATIVEARKVGSAAAVDLAKLVHSDLPDRWVSLHLTPIVSADTDDRRGVLVIRDVTAQTEAAAVRSRLEAQLRQSQRLEAIGQLAGGVAHDFNNLLAAIMAGAELLQDEVEGEALEEVEEIRQSAKRGADLTRKLLVFSRRDVSQPEVLDVNEVIDDLEGLLARTLGDGVEVVTDLDDEATVEIDPTELEQVLMNLCLNARDAMPDGGRVLVETRSVRVEAETVSGLEAGAYVVVTVTDEGEGMSPEVRARAMEPFFTTKEVGKGTGLGLPTIYGIATRAKGAVTIYSEPGLGTTVRVYFPAASGPAAPGRVPAQADQVRVGGRRILLVEDEPGVRATTSRLLSKHGYEVVQAGDGAEALTAIADGRFDAVLSDIVMPGGMTGADLATQLRSTDPDLAVVLMSGYSRGAVSGRGLLPEGVHLVEKPFTVASLLTRIEEACERSRLAAAR